MDRRRPHPIGAMRVRRIIEQASRLFDIPVADIMGPRRHANIVAARQAACLAAYEIGWSSTSIGRIINRRDHTTILHARNMAREREKRVAHYSFRLAELRKFARQPMTAPYLDGEPDRPIAAVPPVIAQPVPDKRPKVEKPDAGVVDQVNRREGSGKLLAALRTHFPERLAA